MKGRKNIKTFHVGNFENYSVAIAMRGTSRISLMQREKFFERRNEAYKGSPKKKKEKKKKNKKKEKRETKMEHKKIKRNKKSGVHRDVCVRDRERYR